MKHLAGAVGLAVALVLSLPALADGFTDDDGRPGELALEWLAEREVIHGCDPPTNRSSCYDSPITRAEAAKILVRLARQTGALDGTRPGTRDHFTDDDVTWGGSAQPYINHLADVGIVHGCDPPHNSSFCPDGTLRRGEIAKMVVRTFDLTAPVAFQSPWVDTAGQFFDEAARVAAHHRLVDTSGDRFDGHSYMDRADFARFVVAVFEPDLCADDPFGNGRVADLEEAHPRVDFTAYAHDLSTGCSYALAPGSRQQTASVFKVMVMGGTFLEAQSDGRSLTSQERRWLEPMITRSANPPVRDLWHSFGGAPWFGRQADAFGLDETTVVGDHQLAWGRTRTSAFDQGDLLRQVLLGDGGRVDEGHRQVAFELMTSVVSSQTWGVSRGVPSGWTVAQKNGFAGATANSVGIVYDDAGRPRYVAVILTQGWPSWRDGVAAVDQIGGWVSSKLAGA